MLHSLEPHKYSGNIQYLYKEYRDKKKTNNKGIAMKKSFRTTTIMLF